MKPTLRIARRADAIRPFIVMEILERAKAMEAAGERIIHLEIGEPDFDTPEPVRRAGMEAIEGGESRYTHSLGLAELRAAIRDHVKATSGVAVSPERIVVTAGTSNALFLTLAALLDPGDEAIITTPGYSCYPNFVEFLGAKAVTVTLHEEEGWKLSAERVAARVTPRTRAILVNSPANPTGMLVPDRVMEKLATMGPTVISDEIYHGLVYEGRPRSMLEFTDDCVVIDGFSKRYAMTGWRLGYAVVPPRLVRPMQKMQQNFTISPNSFAQWAGIAALREGEPYVEEMRRAYDRRRQVMLTALGKAGLGVTHIPQGAFYVMVDVRRFGTPSLALAMELLEQAKVAATPGIDFGPGGEGYLRLSYAAGEEAIAEGVARIGAHLSGR